MKILLLSALILFPLSAFSIELSPYIGAGYETGGDDLIFVSFTNGDSEELKAGQGLSFTVGADFPLPHELMIRATFGHRFDSIDAENGDAEFSINAINLIAYKFLSTHHGLGLGIAEHSSVEASCNFDEICSGSIKYDNATGLIVEYLYDAKRTDQTSYTIGVRYTQIDYSFSGFPDTNGNSIGINIGAKFNLNKR